MKKIKLQEVLAGGAGGMIEMDPSGVTPLGDGKTTFGSGYVGPVIIQNPTGTAFDPASKETRLGMGFEITSKDYDAAKQLAKQYGVDIDKTDKPWQALNKARQNERIQMVKQKGIDMGLISPEVGIETMSFSQNANPQTVLDSPINKWMLDNIRDPNVAFAKKNQETVQEQMDATTPPTGQKTKKTKQNFSQALGFRVDPNTEKKVKSIIKSSGVKPTGNVYKDLTAAQNRINIVNAWRRSVKGV